MTVFSLDVKQRSESQVELARTMVKRLKTLRHPNVLTFVDSFEVGNMFHYKLGIQAHGRTRCEITSNKYCITTVSFLFGPFFL